MCCFGGDGDDGAQGRSAVAPAREQCEGGPGTISAALVEVGRVAACRRRTIALGLQDEHGCRAVLVCVAGLPEGQVAAAAHARVGVVDADVGGVVAVEWDPDLEGLG